MGQEYRRANTTVSLINYHFVFCPRYRRKALVNEVDRRFREVLQQVCDEHELTIVALEVMPDHVHLFVNAPPSISPSDVMAKVKGVTSRRLRQEFKHLRHLPSLWTRSFFCSTAGNVSSDTIQRYIAEQKTRG
jgi:putative transposase